MSDVGRYSLYLQSRGRLSRTEQGPGAPAGQRVSWLADGDDLVAMLTMAEELFALPGVREVRIRVNGHGASSFNGRNVIRLTRHDVTGAETRAWGDGANTVGEGNAAAADASGHDDRQASAASSAVEDVVTHAVGDAVAPLVKVVTDAVNQLARRMEAWLGDGGA